MISRYHLHTPVIIASPVKKKKEKHLCLRLRFFFDNYRTDEFRTFDNNFVAGDQTLKKNFVFPFSFDAFITFSR